MKDTAEQSFAIALAKDAACVRVNAAAGAGKSHLLRQIAKSQNSRFLYLTFSRLLADEAKRSFPRNADCMTAHGFAFRQLDGTKKLRTKLSRKMTGELGGELLGLRGDVQEQNDTVDVLIQIIEKFSNSVTERIGLEHVPDLNFSYTQKDRFVRLAQDLWALMSSRENTMPITHDMYLKVFQLRNEDLQSQYDCILVDEAQDFSPVMLQIIKQSHCRRVVVGDRHQQIYSFRGSINALDQFDDSAEAVLSQSFRYGDQIAEFANLVLGFKEQRPNFRIKGSEKVNSVAVVGSALDLPFESCSHTIIGRTNAALFETAMYLNSLMPTLKVNFVDGVDRYMRPIEQCYQLWIGNRDKVVDYPFKRYATYELFSKNAEQKHSGLEWLCRLFSEFGDDVWSMAKSVESSVVSDARRAAVLFGTAHSTKGREFDNVALLDDFKTPSQLEKIRYDLIKGGNWSSQDQVAHEEEINMLYVAGTRAKKMLIVPDKIAGDL